jgi:hypothetical protein
MARPNTSINNYCNNIYTELSAVKAKLEGFIGQVEGFKGKEGEHIRSHGDHLREIIKTIDWKLEIFTKACPLDSGGYDEGVIEGASVPAGEGDKFSGGYVGG